MGRSFEQAHEGILGSLAESHSFHENLETEASMRRRSLPGHVTHVYIGRIGYSYIYEHR